MSDIDETKQTVRKVLGPEMHEIVEDIEHHSRILQDSGRLSEAHNLREWARELRQKVAQKSF